MSKIERLKATRAAHRGVVSKLKKETHELLSREDTAENRNRLDVITCLLENKLKTLNEIDDQIIQLCPLEDISKEIEDSEEIVARIIVSQEDRRIKANRFNHQSCTTNRIRSIRITSSCKQDC